MNKVKLTSAEKSAIQWLIGKGAASEAYSFSLERYYQDRGTARHRCEAASTRMVNQLKRKGCIEAAPSRARPEEQHSEP